MRRFAGLILLAVLSFALAPAEEPKVAPTPPEGVLPTGADGKPLNLDFETGTLKDWTPEGEAFQGQPIKGDTVNKRRGDMHSRHQGNYWIGGYELKGDRPQGTLTSVAFKVTHPWASFLVGGGASPETCVELVRNDTKEVFSRTSGLEEEDMRRVAVDLRQQMGKEIFIRLVDKHSGGWGHVNFDDFRFHSTKPDVPERKGPAAPDVYKFAGLPPDKAAAAMTVPEGFTVSLFAGEPDVRQPIAFCLDDRGRLWVAEAYTYPVRAPEGKGKDRILIFEDTKGAGHFDKRTVFMEGLNLVSGIEVGFGGVWIGAAPYLMFVPVKEGEDKPAGPPQILLDGWHYEDTHETLNTFCWGPDGWLYGCHGVFTHSRVGKPGTPDRDRVPINAGVWRYHPTRHTFEVFAHGTSNPWGLDFDEHGQAFIEACVIPHAFHVIQGARYQRQAGAHFNPHTYADIPTIADHLHYVGATPHGGNNRSDSAGGGHAHCGLMIYQGGAWPQEYRGKMFMGNIHGRRLNMDVLRPKGSGFVASHGPDFLLANDAWARFINMRTGPDGNVYVLDWYDKQACHHTDPNIWDRDNGRIYKVSFRGTKPAPKIDLQKCGDEELVAYQKSDNDWFVRHARRVLQERYGDKERRGAKLEAFHKVEGALGEMVKKEKDEKVRLRALWALHAVGGTEPALLPRVLDSLLHDKSEYVRAWTVQLALEDRGQANSASFPPKLVELAKTDPSPVVRLYLASALQRRPSLTTYEEVLAALLAHGEDAGDHNLPLMYWYALEPLAGREPGKALGLAMKGKIPLLLPFTARRIASDAKPEGLSLLAKALGGEEIDARRLAILRGVNEALKGRRQVEMPKEWPAAFASLSRSKDAAVRAEATALAVTFGDAGAFAELRRTLAARDADLSARQGALAALLGAGDKQLPPVLHELVKEPAMRGPALRGLAAYDDPKTPDVILTAYPSLTAAEKRDALNALASRAAYGKALMRAVAARKVPANDVPAEVVRQLRGLGDADLDRAIGDAWGLVRTTPADRARLIADWKKKLTGPGPEPDLAHGRAVFAKVCQQCHTLYGVGGKVGPDITGSNRGNLDYLLENVLDPSAVIPNDYKMTVITDRKGRTIQGIVRGETDAALTVVTANETLTVPKKEIEKRQISDVSMMPDDLLKPLSDADVRALVAYLRHPSQTQILATPDNAKDLFNGKDLSGWDGDPQLWSVQDGEIVGKSPGIKKNAFLTSHMVATDFRLTLKVKLVPDKENSGVQFRSESLADGEMRGPQADVGAGWWGKLYEESGRGVLADNKSGEKVVNVDGWNEYEIVAEGSRVRTFLNGKPCVDIDDPKISRRGIFGLQIHSGGPMEVRFKDVKLEVLTPQRPEK
jgi:putative membrane-bound dehydrogenase-like protein